MAEEENEYLELSFEDNGAIWLNSSSFLLISLTLHFLKAQRILINKIILIRLSRNYVSSLV